MKLISTLCLSLALATTAASADPAKKPATPPADKPAAPSTDKPAEKPADKPAGETVSEADAKKFLVFWDTLVDTIVKDKDTCPKMAADVNALIDANKDLLVMAKDAADKNKKLPKSAEDHMNGSMQKLMGGMAKCGQDKDVLAALNRLDMKKGK